MHRPRPSTGWVPAAIALLLSLLVLGPALGPGMVFAYDLAWSPDVRLTPYVLGTDTPAPRAVPSEAAAAALGLILTPALAQKLVLVGLLVIAGLGCRALLRELRPTAGVAAQCAAVVSGVWGPFVAERLVIGQWTVLLGYAVSPWALRAVLRLRAGSSAAAPLCGWIGLAGVGGPNPLAIVAPASLLLLVFPEARWRAAGLVALTSLGASAAWSVPALLRAPETARDGFAVFGARPDTPLGLLGSLVSGGGIWNPAAHLPERSSWLPATLALLVAVTSIVAVAAVRHGGPIVAVAAGGLALAVVSGSSRTESVWSVLADVPGGGLLRDGQKFVAVVAVVAAVGLGILVDALVDRRGLGVFAASGLLLLPVLALPSLAWGVNGRLDSVAVPADLRAAAATLSGAPRGTVGLLPWRQYRRYEWNEGRVSLSLAPRMVDQVVRYDDALPLSTGRIAGEDARAAAITAAIDGGASELDAIAAAGVRYVVIERGTGLPEARAPSSLGRVLHASEHVTIIERAGGTQRPDSGPLDSSPRRPWDSAAGWVVTLVTLIVVAGGSARTALSGIPRKAKSVATLAP